MNKIISAFIIQVDVNKNEGDQNIQKKPKGDYSKFAKPQNFHNIFVWLVENKIASIKIVVMRSKLIQSAN